MRLPKRPPHFFGYVLLGSLLFATLGTLALVPSGAVMSSNAQPASPAELHATAFAPASPAQHLASASAPASPALPAAYTYADTLGTAGVAYPRSGAFLNQPWGLAGDKEAVWVVEAAGRRVLRYGTSRVDEIGRAGAWWSIYDHALRWLSDVDYRLTTAPPVAPPPTPTTRPGFPTPTPATPTPLPPVTELWIADRDAHAVVGLWRSAAGTVQRTMVLGRPDEPGADNFHFQSPTGVAVDSLGYVYVSDTGNQRVQVFDPQQHWVATLGQTGQTGGANDRLNRPARLAIANADGRLYVADTGNHRVQVFDVRDPAHPSWVHTFGRTGQPGPADDQLDSPLGVAVGGSLLYVADSGNKRVQVFALGSGKLYLTLDPIDCEISRRASAMPSDVAVDGTTGDVSIALPLDMRITTCHKTTIGSPFAPDMGIGQTGVPYVNQSGFYNAPEGVAVGPDGGVAIAEAEGQRATLLDANGRAAWQFGVAGLSGADDQHLNHPSDLAVDSGSQTYVVDRANNRVLVVDPTGNVVANWDGLTNAGGGSGTGLVHLSAPEGVGVLPDGRVAVADTGNRRVVLFNTSGQVVSTLDAATGPDTAFAAPADVAVDGRGRWYVADRVLDVVKVFDGAFKLIRVIGIAGEPGEAFDHFSSPSRLAIGPADWLAVADTGNHRVQVFDADGGMVTTLGGRPDLGTGGLREPHGVAFVSDQGGAGGAGGPGAPGSRLYVADTGNHRVQVFDLAAEPWLPVSVNGFADREQVSVSSLVVFQGNLFAGTSVRSGRAGLWRQADDGSWQRVADPVLDGRSAPAQPPAPAPAMPISFAPLGVLGGRLYVAGAAVSSTLASLAGINASRGADLFRSGDGEHWEQVATGGFGAAQNALVGAMAEYGGRLYAGTATLTDTQAAQIWRSPNGDAGTWTKLALDYPNTTWGRDHTAVSAMAVYSNALMVATCSPAAVQRASPYLWRTTDGQSWQPVGEAVAADLRVYRYPALVGVEGFGRCIGALQPFGDHLYAAVSGRSLDAWLRLGPNSANLVQLLRCQVCDGSDWEQVAAPGLGDPDNQLGASLAVFDEAPFKYLYLALGNPRSGLQVWRSLDGRDWEQVAAGGFGDDNNRDVAIGPNGAAAMTVHDGRLVIATTNRAHGGELWSTAGTRPLAVPTPIRPIATPTPRRPPPGGPARYAKVDQWPIAVAYPASVLGAIRDLAPAADGTVYLADGTLNRVTVLKPDGSWGQSFGGSGSGPDRIGLAGAVGLDEGRGRVYVSDQATDRLLVFDRQGRLQDAWPDLNAWDIDPRADGSVWLADRMTGSARRMGLDGTELERFGSFGSREADQFTGILSVVEDPGGRLFVGDTAIERMLNPATGRLQTVTYPRIRAFERVGATFTRLRTHRLDTPPWNGCQALRLQVLGDDRILAGACIIAGGRLVDTVPGAMPGGDLYALQLRTANLRANRFYAMANYDLNTDDPRNPTFPAIVQFLDNRFTVVAQSWIGQSLAAITRPPAEAVNLPVRLSVAPDDSLVLADAAGVRRFSAAGELRALEAVSTCTSAYPAFGLRPDWTVASGDQVVGIGETIPISTNNFIVAAGRVIDRNCRGGGRTLDRVVDPIWRTTLNKSDIVTTLAVAHEPTRDQFVVMHLYRDNPSPIEDLPARLYLYAFGGYGRKTAVDLPGRERTALWMDVEAGPDGRIYALDALNNIVKVMASDGADIATLAAPKDAWRVAGGPNGEVFVLTSYGHVVRMAADGRELSRFSGLPGPGIPPVSMVDLAVDSSGRVFTVDMLRNQVTVFQADDGGSTAQEGNRCQLTGDKWVAPTDVLLGGTADIFLSLAGDCGFEEVPADIVLAVNTFSSNRGPQLMDNLRVARQILSLIDTDRHRVAVVSFSLKGIVEQPLTHDAALLANALAVLNAGGGVGPNYAALEPADNLLSQSPPERKKVVLILAPTYDDENTLALADQMKARGVLIAAINAPCASVSGDLFNNIPVAPRGIGTGRPALRRVFSRRRPASFLTQGQLVDQLPANMDYVAGSARPPATWDAMTRSLTWSLVDLALSATHGFSLTVRPRQEGLWPTNVQADAQGTDGWGNPVRVDFPIPKLRVYGERPPTATRVPTRTRTPLPVPTSTSTPVLPTPLPTRTPELRALYLPVILHLKPCSPESRHADVMLVIDTSGSMSERTNPTGPTKLDAARDAARAFLGQLIPGQDQSGLVQFNSTATVVVPLNPDPARAVAGLATLAQGTGTRIDLALDAGVAELTGPAHQAGNNQVLILLTDGQPTGTTAEAVTAAADRAHAAGILVFAIGLGNDLDDALMRVIASRPEWYFQAIDTADLTRIYDQIAYTIPCRAEWP